MAELLAWPPLADTLGLIGMLSLMLPALAAARAARRLHDVRRIKLGASVDEAFHRELRDVVALFAERAQPWRPIHGYLLYFGYACLLASYAVRFFRAS